MNSKEFIQTIRKVIREEVQSAVRTELNKFTLSESTIVKKPIIAKPTMKYSNTIKPPAAPRAFSKNTTLNSLLNETQGFNGNGSLAYLNEEINYNDQSEWPTMKTSTINSKLAMPVTDRDGRRIDMEKLAETEAGAAVVSALTKDYSALMKAIDRKKNK